VRFFFVPVVLAAILGAGCAESDQTVDASRSPVARVTPEPDNAEAPPAKGAAPQPAPRESEPPKAATALCKALDGMTPADDGEDYLARLEDVAEEAGFGFPKLVTLARRAFAEGNTRKASSLFARLGTLCAEVVGRRNF
jgi:hypothetical protein